MYDRLYTTSFYGETEQHGTGVAEIVHDMAPEAPLYLIKIFDRDSLRLAKDYCISHGIKVINHSGVMGNTNFNDGQCYYNNPACTANSAFSNGILWVNGMGNYATQHYEATYTDPSGQGWHSTIPSIYAKAGETIEIDFTWNEWPTASSGYDMVLFDDSLGMVAGSLPGGSTPAKSLSWNVYPTGTYYLYILKNSGTNRKFEVYSYNHDISPTVASSSLLSPADASGALAVGAINYGNWTTGPIASYSSRGPTTDGRTKPDISAPDGVSTYTYGASYFDGTSAAAPHVAGAAALLLSKNPNYTVSQLWNALTSSAITMGGSRPNNTYGYGRLNLPTIYKLDVSKSGTGNGTVTSSPSGIDCGSDCIGGFDSGTTVTLTATPDSRSKFSLWSGNCTGTGTTCTLTMNLDKNVTAYFDGKPVITETPASYDFGSIYGSANAFTITNVGLADLTINSISLSGANYSDFNIPFILDNCTGHTLVPYTSCSFTVELLPASGGFKSAALNISSNDPDNGTLSVPVSANVPYTYILSTTASSGGTISPSSATVNFNGSQTFTITPNNNYHITDVKVDSVSVSGYPTSTNTGYTLTLSNTKAAHSISATFSNTYKLTIAKSGIGSGTVTSSPSGLSCGAGCSKSFTYGTSVTLAAAPDSGSTFVGWSGGGCSGTGSCTITLSGDTTVTAIFTAPYIVTSTISAGNEHTAVLRNSGMLWDWGGNWAGQIGDGTTTDRLSPAQIATGVEWIAVSSGYAHTVAIRNDGTLWAWGSNNSGQIGDGTTTNRLSPIQIGTDSDWEAIAAGGDHAIALKSNGTLWAWGENSFGQLGNGNTNNILSPVQIGTSADWKAVSTGNFHTVALKIDGTLWAWGANWFGQVGDGTTTDRYSPVKIGTDTDWKAVSVGDSHTVSLKANGTLWTWGYNGDGELGDGTGNDRYSPAQVDSDNDWASVSAGYYHSMALKTDKTLWGWGSNYYGQLGDGATIDEYSPIRIGSDANWSAIASGSGHTVALKADGTLWAWGQNRSGQLGDATTADRHSPGQTNFQTITITVAAGSGGNVSPLGPVTVSYGASQTFVITPNTGYHISYVTGCGGALNGGTYTTGAITANCTVNANFAINTYTVTPSAGTNGSITPGTPQTVNYNGTSSLSINPAMGYHIETVTGCGGTLNGNTYTTGAITSDCGVTASFAINTYSITASAGANGSISPSGVVTVNYGASQVFTITPAANYHVVDVLVDGTFVGAVTSYTFSNVTAGHTISASFAGSTYTVTPSAGANGSISPATAQTVNYNGTTSFTVTPNTGYHIASVTGCGGALSGNTYTTGAITGDCTVTASFAINSYAITPSAGTNGNISPATAQAVNYNGTTSFTVTPNTGYHIESVTGCGGMLSGNTYTTGAVTSDCIVTASFALNTYVLGVTTSGTGSGVVTSNEAGISCGTDCAETYTYGSVVTLAVVPASGSAFAGWGGDGGCFGTGSCTVTITGDISLTAAFTVPYSGISTVSAGGIHTAAIGNNGTLWTWGGNWYGALGDGTTTDRYFPVQIGSDANWSTVSAGNFHTAAIKTDGTLWTWGANADAQLGDGTTLERWTPVQIGTDTDWLAVSAGYSHTLAIKSNGTLWAWGNNWTGQLGDGTGAFKSTPVQIGTDTNCAAVSARDNHTIALKTDGTLWAWGDNSYGQLGDGTLDGRLSPVQIGADTDWAKISAGVWHTMALKSDGTLWGWGLNWTGELGDGGMEFNPLSPIPIGTDTWTAVKAGYSYTSAVKLDGTLWQWGCSVFGILGDCTTSDMVAIGTDVNWAALAIGEDHVVATKTDGTLWAWGSNWYGQVGDGTTTDRYSPVPLQ